LKAGFNIYKGRGAFIFRVELFKENGVLNGRNCSPNDTASHPRKPEPSAIMAVYFE
jgi:hypothetical protein